MGDLPPEIITEVARWITYNFAAGLSGITGNIWADIFAKAVGGTRLPHHLGVAAIALGTCAWSTKTVECTDPFRKKAVRLISGRNSPLFSFGDVKLDLNKDVQETGQKVLSIWNKRMNVAYGSYESMRQITLLRGDKGDPHFVLFETELKQFAPGDYVWERNKRGNLEGTDKETGQRWFTWQHHGSQFTIHCPVPGHAIRFSIRRPPDLREEIMRKIGFTHEWVSCKPAPNDTIYADKIGSQKTYRRR